MSGVSYPLRCTSTSWLNTTLGVIALAALGTGLGCGEGPEDSELEAVVRNELEVFEPSRIPESLLEVAEDHRILLFAETH